MLKIVTTDGLVPLRFDKYWIQEETNGKDSFGLTIPLDDEQYPLIAEEAEAIDAETGLRYVFQQIDEGAQTATCKGSLCLDELKADVFIGYNSDTHRAAEIVSSVVPKEWTVDDRSGVTIRRTVTLEGGTALDIIDAVCKTFSICVRYNNSTRTITLIDPNSYTPSGTYITDELNLKTCNYKGSSKDFATRLYMRGKDGCTFAEINDGKDYVEDHTYSDKVVSTVWIDERYYVKEDMLAAAKAKLRELAVPSRSYECDVIDLARAKECGAANIYSHLDFSLFTVATLLDRRRNRRVNHQVVRLKRYPNYPEENVVTLSTVAVTVQSKLNTAYTEVTSPNSNFKGSIQSMLDSLASSIADYDGGNLEITKNALGKPSGIRIMDTDSKETAKKVMWLNLEGITYSSQGVDGPYSSVWSFEKSGFVADWIVAGNLLADLITVGKIKDKLGNFLLDLDNGVVKINAADLKLDGQYVGENGRNLILDSSFCGSTSYSGNDYSRTVTGDVVSLSLITPKWYNFRREASVYALSAMRGRTVTASYDYKIDSPIIYAGEEVTSPQWKACTAEVGIGYADGTSVRKVFPVLTGDVSDGWIRRSVALDVADKEISSCYFQFVNQGFTGSVQLRHPTLTVGADSMPWTTAPEDVSSVSGSSGDQTAIFNKLTGGGAQQGLYIKDGKLYINAEYIATGILQAIKIQSSDGSSYWDLAGGGMNMSGTFCTNPVKYSDGTLYRVRLHSDGIFVQRSTDGGATWESPGSLKWNSAVKPYQSWLTVGRVDANSVDTSGIWITGGPNGAALSLLNGQRLLNVENIYSDIANLKQINGYTVQWVWDGNINHWVLASV